MLATSHLTMQGRSTDNFVVSWVEGKGRRWEERGEYVGRSYWTKMWAEESSQWQRTMCVPCTVSRGGMARGRAKTEVGCVQGKRNDFCWAVS